MIVTLAADCRDDAGPLSICRERDVREILPAIDIAVSVEPRVFIERMATLAETTAAYAVERQFDVLGEDGFDIVNFWQLTPCVHDQAGGQLIVRPGETRRVSVEMRALSWTPDPPTRVVYEAFAKQVFGTLLKGYNSTFATRYRLNIRKRTRPYNFPPAADILLRRFAVTANARALHPADWQRFYAFVWHSRTEAPMGALMSLLVKHGFSSASAQALEVVYHHLWAFKRLSKAR